jgi:cobalt-zinc-cadmium efflux system outer membrane protein
VAASLVIPTPQLSLVRQFSAPFGNGNFYALGLSFEVPVLNRYSADRERASAGATAARLSAQRAHAQVERDVLDAVTEFRAARDRAEQYCAGPVAKSAAAVDAARYAYSKGAASLLEVLDALRVDQDVQTEYVTALHDYWVSVYAVNAAVGRDVFRLR